MKQEEHHMTFTTSDSVQLYFQTFGDKDNPAIILIHGLGADGRMWEPQIKTWPEQGYFLIVPDMRGHGSSEPVENFRIEA
ncbi:alpha/beta fold hydrolase [candidate division KSB1 bacterium]|nr:alpha/beta fold hydrolase [candidate division KSB1 bacterium]